LLDGLNATAPLDPSIANGCAYDTEDSYVSVDFCPVN